MYIKVSPKNSRSSQTQAPESSSEPTGGTRTPREEAESDGGHDDDSQAPKQPTLAVMQRHHLAE